MSLSYIRHGEKDAKIWTFACPSCQGAQKVDVEGTASSDRPDISAAIARVKNKFGMGGEIKHPAEYLRPGESLRELAGGRFGKGNGLPALTDQRVIFRFHGLIQRSLEEFRLDRLDSIGISGGVMWTSIMLTVAGNKAVIEQVDKTDAKRFVEATRSAIGNVHAPASAAM